MATKTRPSTNDYCPLTRQCGARAKARCAGVPAGAARADELRVLWALRWSFEDRHHVTAFARNGDICFNEAYASLGDNDRYASWVSIFTVDSDSKIVKYLSYTNMPRLPILGSDAPLTLGS